MSRKRCHRTRPNKSISLQCLSSELFLHHNNAISEQIEEIRLKRNITQSRLALKAGVSRSTITRLARKGKGISLDSFIRILKALRLAHNLAEVLPVRELSPLEELEKNKRPSRLRAREKKQDQKKWIWQDGWQGKSVMTTTSVELWGRRIGAVAWVDDRGMGIFQYMPEFSASGIEVSPLQMPLRETPYSFAELSRETFKGLPGMPADSLPDQFDNALIDVWLARQAHAAASFNPVERLCSTGTRGIGALEYRLAITGAPAKTKKVEVERLVDLSSRILSNRENLVNHLTGENDSREIENILRVGTSAGGARAKAVLAWNEQPGEFRPGQTEADAGFGHWLMKFDGMDENKDREMADPKSFGRIEYACHLMVKKAGIIMMPCRLHEEGGRAHFMTEAF